MPKVMSHPLERGTLLCCFGCLCTSQTCCNLAWVVQPAGRVEGVTSATVLVFTTMSIIYQPRSATISRLYSKKCFSSLKRLDFPVKALGKKRFLSLLEVYCTWSGHMAVVMSHMLSIRGPLPRAYRPLCQHCHLEAHNWFASAYVLTCHSEERRYTIQRAEERAKLSITAWAFYAVFDYHWYFSCFSHSLWTLLLCVFVRLFKRSPFDLWMLSNVLLIFFFFFFWGLNTSTFA